MHESGDGLLWFALIQDRREHLPVPAAASCGEASKFASCAFADTGARLEHTPTPMGGVFDVRWPFLLAALLSTTAAAAEHPSSQRNCPVVEPVLEGPEVDVRAFGAVGDGVHDDTFSIEKAVASLERGGVVKFRPGTYRHNRVLKIDRPGIALVGRDATLLAGDPSQAAIVLSGQESSLRDLRITTTDPGMRGDRDEHSGIVVTGRQNTILRIDVTKSKSAGIIVLGAKDFLVACSTVSQTKADGIHISRAAQNGRVLSNSVWNSEDDGIAVVSYRPDRQASGVVIEGNTVEHIRWGRGIAVVGSKDVVIRRNDNTVHCHGCRDHRGPRGVLEYAWSCECPHRGE